MIDRDKAINKVFKAWDVSYAKAQKVLTKYFEDKPAEAVNLDLEKLLGHDLAPAVHSRYDDKFNYEEMDRAIEAEQDMPPDIIKAVMDRAIADPNDLLPPNYVDVLEELWDEAKMPESCRIMPETIDAAEELIHNLQLAGTRPPSPKQMRFIADLWDRAGTPQHEREMPKGWGASELINKLKIQCGWET